MVGLVLISHSQKLASALVDLISTTVSDDLPVIAAGGAGLQQEIVGTDATQICAAVDRVFSSDGVLILLDTGSAILSAETARDLLRPDQQEKIRLCSAPLVEGAIAAAVQIKFGSTLSEVAQAAETSLMAKQEQIGGIAFAPEADASAAVQPETEICEIQINNEHGLHLRPAAGLLKALAPLSASVQVFNLTTKRGPVPVDSLTALARLQIKEGDLLRFQASGADRSIALVTIQQLAAQNFGETRAGAPAPVAKQDESSQLFSVSAGVAVGPPLFVEDRMPPATDQPLRDPETADDAVKVLRAAIAQTVNEFGERAARLEREINGEARSMVEAQQLLLQDREVLREVEERIRTRHESAARAWEIVFSGLASEQADSSDPYLRDRAADLREVEQAVLRKLMLRPSSEIRLEANSTGRILICDELNASLLDLAYRAKVAGVVELSGGPNSHGAILARALRLPALGGAASHLEELRTATVVALDGANGELWIDPDEVTLRLLQERRETEGIAFRRLLTTAGHPVKTRDKTNVRVAANAGSESEVIEAHAVFADGIGLFRTEFLYQNFQQPPTEDEQISVLARVLEAAGDLSVNVRLLDTGADKPAPFFPARTERNPFLGIRGVRLLLAQPDFFRTHLRALLRVAHERKVALLLPMITEPGELRTVRQLLNGCHESLLQRGVPHAWPLPLGIMVETPAAALLFDQFATQVEFASIGTNDLTQYVLSSERGNSALAHFGDALHPAVLRLCAAVSQKARETAIPLSICGEIAADLEALPVLVAIGLTQFSVGAATVPAVKARLREMVCLDSQQLAELMSLPDAAAVRTRLVKLTSEMAV
jgi:multiphosphoryl transfer protein